MLKLKKRNKKTNETNFKHKMGRDGGKWVIFQTRGDSKITLNGGHGEKTLVPHYFLSSIFPPQPNTLSYHFLRTFLSLIFYHPN